MIKSISYYDYAVDRRTSGIHQYSTHKVTTQSSIFSTTDQGNDRIGAKALCQTKAPPNALSKLKTHHTSIRSFPRSVVLNIKG